MLVRRGHVFTKTSRPWTTHHRAWLDALAFDNQLDRVTVAEYKLAIDQAERRLKGLDEELTRAAQLPLYRDQVGWLRCFHGIDTVIAMVFVAELHGIERFDSPRKLAAYQPEAVIAIADTARDRLTKRFQRLLARGKNRNKAVITVMRELVGFLWAALRIGSEPAVQRRTQVFEDRSRPAARGTKGETRELTLR